MSGGNGILIIDDHPLFRKGVVQLIAMAPHLEVGGEVSHGELGGAQEAPRRRIHPGGAFPGKVRQKDQPSRTNRHLLGHSGQAIISGFSSQGKDIFPKPAQGLTGR